MAASFFKGGHRLFVGTSLLAIEATRCAWCDASRASCAPADADWVLAASPASAAWTGRTFASSWVGEI